MPLARSRLTVQSQVSVPAKVRQKLGVGPGSVLEWDADGDRVVVRRAGRHSSEAVHHAIFPRPPAPKTLAEMDAGIGRDIKRRRARR